MKDKPPQEWDGDGFDTETLQGWARLLCTSDDHLLITRGKWENAFEFLLSHGPRLVAWNLRFDAEAVLKHLGQSPLVRLFAEEHLNVKHYSIDLVPWKMVRISDGDRTTEIFDIAPFYGSRLDAAARRFLHKKKLAMDAGALNLSLEAWTPEQMPRIIRYCKRDAWLTNQLANQVSQRFVKLGGSFHKPYSVAFVAADILMRDAIVPKLPPHMEPVAEGAFRGARFECLSRGRLLKGYAYDIKSAYPAHLRLVADAKGRWVQSVRPHKDALHAIVKCRAVVPPDDHSDLAPFPIFRRGFTIYPTGNFETAVLLATYEKFENLLEPIESWSFIPTGKISFPYRATVDKLLSFREESDALLKDAAKRGNNSLYGKLLNQRMENKLIQDEGGDHFTGQRVIIDGVPYRRERVRKKGLLYNPLHAGIVTEACRLQIWDAAQRAPDHVHMIQADGIITSKPFLGKEKARVAGDLGFVAEGDTVICGSGLYEIRGYARRTRGVMLGGADNEDKGGRAKKLKGPSWFGLLRGKRNQKIQFTDTRPAHLSECLRGAKYRSTANEERNLGLKDANVFLPFVRNLNVCKDDKRLWPAIPEARQLLTHTFRSVPIYLEE